MTEPTQGPTQADRETATDLCRMYTGSSYGAVRQIDSIAHALAAAREQGRAEQAAHDLPAALEQEVSGNRLQAMLDRIIGDGVKQGLVRLGGADGHTLIAAPEGHILDDKGVVRRVLGTLPVTADGCVVGMGASVWCGGAVVEWRNFRMVGQMVLEQEAFVGRHSMCSAVAVDAQIPCYSTREAALAARGNT